MSPATEQLVLWLIPGAPLVAALVIALLGKSLLHERSHWPCWLALATSMVCAILLVTKVVPGTFADHDESVVGAIATGYSWLKVGSIDVRIDLRADAMSALMLTMVTSVSFLVSVFASGYMHGDKGYPRFFGAVSLFVFSMVMLVLSANYLQLFIFWELVGLCSYLLIGFWFQKPSAAAAAKKAFVVNRIGDMGLILGIFLIWDTFGTMDFSKVLFDADELSLIAGDHPTRMVAICFLLLIGAMGKSAQFPLHVWLPDAMEGPTPVSALIHAATMVTAGVYLVARSTPLFMYAPSAQVFISCIGATTALIAALIALTQTDLKRVLAYSTVSQLGYMFMALGVGAAGAELATAGATAGMFHLVTHGVFKALLFLAAGSVMHSMGDVIDMRRFSGLRKVIPVTHWTFLCGAAALAGVPLLAGFWSKDEILAVLHEAGHHSEKYGTAFTAVYWIATITALLTAFYTFRAYFMTFWGPERTPPEAGHHPHDAPPAMAWPLRILAVGALTAGGAVAITHLFAHYFEHTPGFAHIEQHVFHINLMVQSGIIALVGIAAAWFMYVKNPMLPAKFAQGLNFAYDISSRKFFLDEIFTAILVMPLRGLAKLCFLFDVHVIDRIVDGVGALPRILSAAPRLLQTGYISSYALMMWVGALACMGYMLGLFDR
ncbi:NADH-quinone oxidoreductase subunit L [Lacipirellula parvula]|uniref:NADH-ubiquinone oxidoreductase chain L n=1 Tax=Lacipirellula parvula TaxID=2650471 RepID=A0A5K7XG11_9BACT|nr:NADH-quinone oxidoreductase subunit L [Lacipirellula parvula]BBO31909.1 NADH-ubiquinone oxidoreductase chain L [Lacipirellula parvula]